MICPKCKTEVSNKDTVCPNCNLRLIFKCPRCGESTRLGSARCKKCGFTFVKFCPKCGSANYASSSVCRKCGKEFVNENTQSDENYKEINLQPLKPDDTPPKRKSSAHSLLDRFERQKKQQEPEKPKKEPEKKQETPVDTAETVNTQAPEPKEIKPPKEQEKEDKTTQPFLFYIDFINLETTFEKFDDEKFKQKVIQNIKTTVKIAFGQDCDFINAHSVMFKFLYNKSSKLLKKIEVFEKEFIKFNQLLEKTLDTGLSYKFAISTIEEVKKNKEVNQLKLGSEKDIIVSAGTYSQLNSELSLIKISPDSYKMIFLDKKPVFEQSEAEKYEKALEIILTNLSEPNSTVRAISVNAGRGVGKTHLLTEVYNRAKALNLNNTLIFYAQCSALTQISPYGLIQNFFMSLFECPNILKNEFNIKLFEKKVLEKLNLNKINPDTLETLANLIYPVKKDNFERILINKQYTFEYLKDIFEQIKHKKNIIFIVDDFDLIDESSYSFLKYLVASDYFMHDAKLILGYKNEHSISIYFQSNKFNNNNCLNISLRSFSVAESKIFIKKVLGENSTVPDEILSQIAYNAQGNIAYIEQILQYLFEQKVFYFNNDTVKFKIEKSDFEIPNTMEACFSKRLDYLKEQNEKEYIFINTASLLGDKLDYKTLSTIFKLNEDEFFETVKKLEKKGYLKLKADNVYGFKNSLTWSYCYIKAKEEPLIKNDVKNLLIELNDKIISTPLICPILAQIIDNKDLAFSLWTKNLQFANYIGDTNIYAMAQKQSLILLESVKLDNFEYTKNNICERLGKLIYEKNPAEAKDYLAYAVASAQKNDEVNKVIDLSGYLIKSAYLIQDYTGVREIVDNILKYFDGKDRTEKKATVDLQNALIKTKKLEALLNLGCWEEITNIVNNEINPVLEKNLKLFGNKKHKWINQTEIYDTYVKANIILAQSYSQQGSPLATDLIKELDKEINKSKTKSYDTLKVLLLYAMAMYYTSKGYFGDSSLVLQDILKEYSYVIDKPELVCKWNIINLINKVLKNDTQNIRQDLFEATTYANNCNDEVSKNLLKTLLAFVFLEEKTYLKAIEIANEQMQFFSERKLAFGAMLSWYISVAATVQTKADTYCIEVCEKAVKICENAQNNNYYFKILFQELLARAYLKLNDKENAKMYCDLALQSANMNELLYLQVRLNDLKAELARECLASQPDKSKYEYAMNTIKIYENTINLAKMLGLKQYITKLNKDLTSFKAHCQLNRIIEDK